MSALVDSSDDALLENYQNAVAQMTDLKQGN